MSTKVAKAAGFGCIAAAVGGGAILVGHALIGMVVVHVVGALLHPMIRLLAV